MLILPDKAYQPIEIVKTEKILSRLKKRLLLTEVFHRLL